MCTGNEVEMASPLERLRGLLGEPEEPWGWPRRQIWEDSEEHLGTALPSDYKAFMDLYGPGTLGGYLHLDRPTDLLTPDELAAFWSLDGLREARAGHEEFSPFPFHPDPGGLICWGGDEHCNEYYFLPGDADPGAWEIVVGSEAGEWYRTDGPFTAFLTRCFDRLDRAPFMDRSWPEAHARYEPADG
ncbi:SMI1/KNR4 family protein [Streptomyces sp. AM 2-1-1]|uniref:SMI1/KNR4 family protein n=1 Tax=Streptomyces sp. AM 2-1-1 TaxID=3028709 RepID=UPI0023B8C3F9|nr:SMI1/KNR4 family protein [Streptomyces sp. AM 2-1-1]WEH40375.1 SMI1/KNR4 family protein [Streptomyces sp. AM 2-1-1]